MNLDWFKKNMPLILIITLGFWIFVFTIYDIIFSKNWQVYLAESYIILFLLLIFVAILYHTKKSVSPLSIEEFEKTLKGGLFHFKCPECGGIFAIKKSRSNDKKRVRMNCPDCGAVGIIPVNPFCIEEKIPEKKSSKAVFRCKSCGEGITLWAEGSELYPHIEIYNCPFCGIQKPLSKY